MGQKQIEELFFENPPKEFYLRQISRLTNTPKSTSARIIDKLFREKLIIRKKSEFHYVYSANVENSMYRFYKRYFIIEKIEKSGIIDYIVENANPRAIILFGSCAKGEYNQESDIDFYIASSETKLNLDKFRLKHKVNLFFEPNLSKLSTELKNNIINGVILYGMIRLFH